ncbi:hypothetical protein ACIQCF_17285 [Streptomyces sp. NPDC088353]|uniref:hypothetical protein n=1 Tax=unclassified Streptomyces TaxID=2593676 RepID=UPI00367B78FE
MASAHDVYAPGHLGELTQVIDPQLVDAVLEEMAASGTAPAGPVSLVGAIGRTALASLLPKGRRWRLKARVRKRNSKYTFTTGKHPRTAQTYTLHFDMIKEGGSLDTTNCG